MSKNKKVEINFDGKKIQFHCYQSTKGENFIDISSLSKQLNLFTFDPGYANTAPSKSEITYLNGEKGILCYRGYTIEQLTKEKTFVEIIYLLYYGKLPTQQQLEQFKKDIFQYFYLPEGLIKLCHHLPNSLHPMAVISILISALLGYFPNLNRQDDKAAFILLGMMTSIVALAHCKLIAKDISYPDKLGSIAYNYLVMAFGKDFKVDPLVEKVLNQFLILHADHEFNCSTSTVRLVASSQSNLFSCISSGVSALWGPLHGGANQKVIEMLKDIQSSDLTIEKFLEQVKDKSNPTKLMGFGHRLYKNYDPRARIVKETCEKLLKDVDSPLLKIAKELEAKALADNYFISRNLYPNVDFYTGIVYQHLNIPIEMYTPLFALGRIPGWISHWKEYNNDPQAKIGRPRQLYLGS